MKFKWLLLVQRRIRQLEIEEAARRIVEQRKGAERRANGYGVGAPSRPPLGETHPVEW
jgi:hypothetical protein